MGVLHERFFKQPQTAETSEPATLNDIYTALIEDRQSTLSSRQRNKLAGHVLEVYEPAEIGIKPVQFEVAKGTTVFLGTDTDPNKLVMATAFGYFLENDTYAIIGGIHEPTFGTFLGLDTGIHKHYRNPEDFGHLVSGRYAMTHEYLLFRAGIAGLQIGNAYTLELHPYKEHPAVTDITNTIFNAAKNKFTPYIPKQF